MTLYILNGRQRSNNQLIFKLRNKTAITGGEIVNFTVSEFKCPTPCEKFVLDVGSRNHRVTKRSMEQYLYFPARLMYNKELFIYPLSSLAGDIGYMKTVIMGKNVIVVSN